MAFSSSPPGFYNLLLLLWVVVAMSNSSLLRTLAIDVTPCKVDAKNDDQECNIFEGRWVRVKKSSPPYNYTSCPFIRPQFNCQKNGRPDSLYLEFRWQPDECNLPRFNAHDFLRRFRGKNIIFAGDSLMLNQWESLICLILSAVPRAKYTLIRPPYHHVNLFHLHDYEVSIMMEWHLFLVENGNGSRGGRALKLDHMKSNEWRGADVLVFDSYQWWFYNKTNKPWDYMEVGGKTYTNLDRTVAFKIALETWERWVDQNINHTKTRVFYHGISPSHYRGREWGQPQLKGCATRNLPIRGHGYHLPENPAIGMVKSVLSRMKHKAYFLDISKLSHLRPDAHPSVYVNPALPRGPGSDCMHWCLPGLPDTWNHLLYASLL